MKRRLITAKMEMTFGPNTSDLSYGKVSEENTSLVDQEGTNLALLCRTFGAAFPSDKDVNDALRSLIQGHQSHP